MIGLTLADGKRVLTTAQKITPLGSNTTCLRKSQQHCTCYRTFLQH
jgi:hypothetical protein